MDDIIATCDSCGWDHTVTEPEDGQSLFGTLAWYMRQHEATAKLHGQNTTRIDWQAMGLPPTEVV